MKQQRRLDVRKYSFSMRTKTTDRDGINYILIVHVLVVLISSRTE